MMMDQRLPKISKNKGGRHLFEILSQIKDCIAKKRYNLAWEMASKHYEQNKNSLTNEEIYYLCQQSCTAIERKINHRLTAKNKRYVTAVTNSHIQHVLSLEMSLHGIVLPELVQLDPGYFNMLGNEAESMNPKSIAQEELVFERKNSNDFLSPDSVHKTLKKMVKQHLKICNSVLMFKIARRKSITQVTDNLGVVQGIFDQFKEHEFPSEIMDFELIKLSIIQDLNVREGVRCEYRLPLGFLGKIYHHLKRGREELLEHYLKKLNAYLVLSFRHLNVSIQDVFIGCCEARFIGKMVQSISAASSGNIPLDHGSLFRKSVKRLMTIESEEDYAMRSTKRRQDYNETEKKIESKTKVSERAEARLMESAAYGLKAIQHHLRGRKELSEIILRYFVGWQLKEKKDPFSKEEYIDVPVVLNVSMKSRKRGQNDSEEEKSSTLFKSKYKHLTSICTPSKNRAKTIFDSDDRQPELLKFPLRQKSQGKFISKNIQQVRKPVELKANYYQEVGHLLQNLQKMEEKIVFLDIGSNAEEHQFEKERKKKIEEFRLKLAAKNQRNRSTTGPFKQADELSPEQSSADHLDGKPKPICLLDQVVQSQINTVMFQDRCEVSPLKKIEDLRNDVDNLTTERKLLVETLSMRQNQSEEFAKENSASYSRYMDSVGGSGKEQTEVLVDSFRGRVDYFCKSTRRLMNLQKDKDSFLPRKSGKLKLEDAHRKEKRLSELNFEGIEKGYHKLSGRAGEDPQSETSLKTQFDKLRRDVAKNQFMAQNQKRNKMQRNSHYPTILQATKQDQTLLI